jgi:diguanylate cyclase (GGDEF)-like protein/PAS domain S-box-containing protein
MNAQYRVTQFDSGAEDLWGMAQADVIGTPVNELLHPLLRRSNPPDPVHLIERSQELPILRKDGQTRWVSLTLIRPPAPDAGDPDQDNPEATRYIALLKALPPGPTRPHPLLQLARAIDASDHAIFVASPDGRIVFINRGVTRMLGYTIEEIEGQLVPWVLASTHTDTDALQAVEAYVQSCSQRIGGAAQGHHAELLIHTRSARPLWVSLAINPVFDEGGQLVNILTALTDITLTKMHEVLQNKVLAATVQERPITEVLTLMCREIERIAPEVVATVLGIDAEGCVRPLAAPSMPEAVSLALDGLKIGPVCGSCGTAAWRGESVLVTDIATDPLWADYKALVLPLGLRACWSSPIKGGDGKVRGTFAFYYREPRGPSRFHERLVDISLHLCALVLEREEARTRLHQLAFFDVLTGLPNRDALRAHAARVVFEIRSSNAPMALLHLDLNRFKNINDTHGHAAGDALLREVAQRIKTTIGEGHAVGRLAGNEFLVVAPYLGTQSAAQLAERLVAALCQPVQVGTQQAQPSVAIGIAMSPQDGADIDTLSRHADMAMHQAKSARESAFRFFSAEMNQQVQEHAMLEADLRLALQQDHLHLHYQPKVSPSGARLMGVEALLRWQHPQLGAVPPMRFVALAEECGLIGLLSAWVLAHACRQMADWRRRLVPIPNVAVNLSVSNFRDATLPMQVASLLQQHHLQPGDLTLEMTESVMLDDHPQVLATVHAVRALGVHLSLDDFGTGYSSLANLHRLPIQELKLDRSFVQDLEHSAVARALTTSVLRIGESLDLQVVAEGVETEEQRVFLAERGCSALQGYLFARPLAPAALETWIAERNIRF